MIKKFYLFLAFAGLFFTATPSFAAAVAVAPALEEVAATSDEAAAADKVAKEVEADWKKLSAKEKRAKRKAVKQAVKSALQSGSDVSVVLLVIVAILLPPLAMALYDGITKRFWISLLLTLLFYLPGLIYTLAVILGGK